MKIKALILLSGVMFGCSKNHKTPDFSFAIKELNYGRSHILTLRSNSFSYTFKVLDYDSLYLISNHRKDKYSNLDSLFVSAWREDCLVKQLISSDSAYLASVSESKDAMQLNLFFKKAKVSGDEYSHNKNYFDSFTIKAIISPHSFVLITPVILDSLREAADSISKITAYNDTKKNWGMHCLVSSQKENLAKVTFPAKGMYVFYGSLPMGLLYYLEPKISPDGFLEYRKIILNPCNANFRRSYY